MKVPRAREALVSEEKVVDYLLSGTHRDGRHKASFFERLGCSRPDWQALASALSDHVAMHEIATHRDSPFGMRYSVEGAIHSPRGGRPVIRTIWIVEQPEGIPRLVTAYPLKGKRP